MLDFFIKELKTIGIFLAGFLGLQIVEYDPNIEKWQMFESPNAGVIFRIPKITGKLFFFGQDPVSSQEPQGVWGFFDFWHTHVIYLTKLHKRYNIRHTDIPAIIARCSQKSFKSNTDLFDTLREKLQKEEKETGKHNTISKIKSKKLWGKDVLQIEISELGVNPEQSFYIFTTPSKSYFIEKNLGLHSDEGVKEGIEETFNHLEFTH